MGVDLWNSKHHRWNAVKMAVPKWKQQDDGLAIALPASLPASIASSFPIGF